MNTSAILVSVNGYTIEIDLKTNLEDNFETKGYEEELRLLYTWRIGPKIIEMYGYVDGSIESLNIEEIPEHIRQHPFYYGDVLLMAKGINDNKIPFTYLDFQTMIEESY